MGMFDSLFVDCRCGEPVEFQSKAGKCGLYEYQIHDCPPDVAADLMHTSEQCRACGRNVTLRGAVVLLAEIDA